MSLDLLLPIPDPASLWQQTQFFAIPADRWNAYLNQLCVNAILPYLREEAPQARTALNAASLASIWTFVNGTAFTVNDLRIVVIPSEAINHDEFRVPQEWIDLPTWAADYYLAAQVEPDESWVKVWGIASHYTVKTLGQLDFNDRTYSLSTDFLKNPDLLWLSRDLCPQEPIRAAVADLEPLSLEQATQLIDRLGNPSLINPRLSVPFQRWGALMEHGGWRKKLYQHRQGIQSQESVLQWLSMGVSNLARQLGWERLEMQASMASARGETAQPSTQILSRQLAIAGQIYELQIIPQDENTWRFELRHTLPGGLIPGGFKLRLLTEDLQPFEGNEAIAQTAVECLFIEVALEEGEGLVWETEPIAEGYDREILRFS